MGASARAIAAIDLRYLALVLGLVAIDRAVMILRWVLLLRASGIAITTADAARLFLVSSFVGSFLPAGVGADAARAYGLSRAPAALDSPSQDPGQAQDPSPRSEALASVAVDRILGVFSHRRDVDGRRDRVGAGARRLAHRGGDSGADDRVQRGVLGGRLAALGDPRRVTTAIRSRAAC